MTVIDQMLQMVVSRSLVVGWLTCSGLSKGNISTHDRSNGVAGCDEPPIVWAKLVIEPLFWRGFPRTPLPIGAPPAPPNAHIAPLLAKFHQPSALYGLTSVNVGRRYANPSFHLEVFSLTRFCFVVTVADLGSRLVCRVTVVDRLLSITIVSLNLVERIRAAEGAREFGHESAQLCKRDAEMPRH